MPMTNAQRQKRYRQRHHDDLAHITLDVRVAVRDRLDRLAWHFDWSLTQPVEELAARGERAVEAELPGAALKTYRAAGYEDTAYSAFGQAPSTGRLASSGCRRADNRSFGTAINHV